MIRFSALALAGLGAAVVASIAVLSAAGAQSPAEQRGMTFVQTNCARCHSIDKVGPSPLRPAPPFRDLHLRYPVESLAEAFAEGIRTGHPSMPEFRLDPGQIRDVIAYLKSLER
jgi:cytochrome c